MVAWLETMNTASAPKSRTACRARSSRSGFPRSVVSQTSASGWAAMTSSTSASPYVARGARVDQTSRAGTRAASSCPSAGPIPLPVTT